MGLVSEKERSCQALEVALILFFFAWLVWNCFVGERIPEGNGVGFDGVFYAHLAEQFSVPVFHHQLPVYGIQRIVPSAIIYYIGRLFHISITYDQMPLVFSVYNTIILFLAVYFWYRIANFLRWNGAVRIISFCGLFLNYAILKMNTYDPVLTDTSAFVCGLAMLYFYLINRKWALLVCTLAGTFIFPTLMYMGLLLFIFPNKDQVNHSFVSFENNRVMTSLFALSGALLFTAAIFLIYWKIGEQDSVALGRYSRFPVLYISLCAVFAYSYFAFYPLVEKFKETLTAIFCQLASYRLIIAVILGVFLKLLVMFLSSGAAGAVTPALFIEAISIRSLAYPFIFLVSNIIYYGPVVCLMVIFWRDLIRNLKKHANWGLFVIAVLYVPLSINTESRQIINFLPVAVIALAQVLNTKTFSFQFVLSFVVLDLLLSRFWLPLSHGWASLITNPPEVTLAFPMQWYFMSFGPWMSHLMYLIFLLVSVMTFIIVRFSAKKILHDS